MSDEPIIKIEDMTEHELYLFIFSNASPEYRKKAYARLHSHSFSIPFAKIEEWKKFREGHPGFTGGASPSKFSYTFTPTSLGEHVEAKHLPSGDTINLTDYDNW